MVAPYTPEQMLAALHERTSLTASGCRVWGGLVRDDGYARVAWRGRAYQVHRLAYELQIGPLGPGMTLDHVCHTEDDSCVGGPCLHRSCLNVDHLEPVSGPENTRRQYPARKTHCANGHPYNEANTYYRTGGGGGIRACRACGRQRVAAYKIRRQMRAAGVAA
jgi:hypothetical protein